MKILHVAQKTKGGVATHMEQLVAAQVAEHGVENVVIVVGADEQQYFEALPPSTLRLFKSSRRAPGAFAQMAWFAHRVIAGERPDLIHVHSTYAGVLVRARYLLSRRAKRPAIVYCAHGWSFNMAIPRWQKRGYAWIERRLARVTDRILCISRFEQESAAMLGLPAEKMVMVYNGLPPLPADAPAKPIGFDPAFLNLLFMGRNTAQKGLPDLFAAMALLEAQAIHLHTVGDRMAGAGDRPNITEHGWQPRPALPGYIAAADVVVMPSHWEGFGLAAIEAMRQGRPVCASAVDALPEIVRPGVSGYLYPCGNVSALADLLAGLERSELRRVGESGLGLFHACFTEDVMIARIAAVYRDVMGTERLDTAVRP